MIGISFVRILFLSFVFLFLAFWPGDGKGAVAPVGQLPAVTISVPTSIYALPILLVESLEEWKDFGIQIKLKVYASGDEQLDRVVGNDWEVGVMDPLYAVKGGNEGNVVIVGVAGNFTSQVQLILGRGASPPTAANLGEWLKGKKILCPVPSEEHYLISELRKRQGDSWNAAVVPVKKEKVSEAITLPGRENLLVARFPQAYSLIHQGFQPGPELKRKRVFLPAFLVASAAYADTRKTLVLRWLEGYSRGIRIIQKNPAMAASRLKMFYRDILQVEVSEQTLQREMGEAFYFDEREREEPFRGGEGKPSAIEELASSMTLYLQGLKSLESKGTPSEYILPKLCDQLSALRKEAMAQLEKAKATIEEAGLAGVRVEGFQKTWEDARMQIHDGRGWLTVIGVLSSLQRSADHARVTRERMRDFRRIEMAIGAILLLYYIGYAIRRKKRKVQIVRA